jgi:DNA polymerase-3 subunit gamma/tau
MRSLVERICEQEGVAVDDAVYPLVIRAGGGSPRDTLSVLDQLLAGADGDQVEYQRALTLLGATDIALIDSSIDALAAGDAAALFGAVEAVMDAGHDPRRFATDLLERFRDLIVLQSVPDAVTRGVVAGPEDVLERMRDQAAKLGTATLTRYAEVVHAGLGEMRGATAPRLLLEVVCARLLLPSASDTESALLQRVERIEMRLDMSIPDGEVPAAPKQFTRKSTAPEPAATTPPPSPPAQPQPAPASTPEPTSEAESKSGEPEPESAPVAATGEPNAAAVRSMWTTVRDKVRERSRTTEVMLSGAIVRAVEGDTLVLSHESAPLAKRLTEQRNADVIRDALKDALGVDWKIRCETGGPAAPAAPEPAVVAPTPRQRPSRTIPEPPPPPPPPPEDDEESMLAEVSSDTSETPRRDPEEVALELLQTELGARPIDGAK